MRVTAMFFLFFTEAAWAANDGSTERMDFANTAAFHSVFEDHAASGLEGPGASGVSAKMRIAMWTSSSVLPSRTEALIAVPPSAIPRVQALEPSERIIAKTVHSAYLEESAPTHQLAKRKRSKRRAVLQPSDIEDEGPSSLLEYQRHALSNQSDLDDAEATGGDAQPSFLGRRKHTKPPANEDDASHLSSPASLARFFLGERLRALNHNSMTVAANRAQADDYSLDHITKAHHGKLERPSPKATKMPRATRVTPCASASRSRRPREAPHRSIASVTRYRRPRCPARYAEKADQIRTSPHKLRAWGSTREKVPPIDLGESRGGRKGGRRSGWHRGP